jgi:hypothetical protein
LPARGIFTDIDPSEYNCVYGYIACNYCYNSISRKTKSKVYSSVLCWLLGIMRESPMGSDRFSRP